MYIQKPPHEHGHRLTMLPSYKPHHKIIIMITIIVKPASRTPITHHVRAHVFHVFRFVLLRQNHAQNLETGGRCQCGGQKYTRRFSTRVVSDYVTRDFATISCYGTPKNILSLRVITYIQNNAHTTTPMLNTRNLQHVGVHTLNKKRRV